MMMVVVVMIIVDKLGMCNLIDILNYYISIILCCITLHYIILSKEV